MIALTLTAILITTLFSFFLESAKVEKKLDQARSAALNRSYLQTRLQSIFVGSKDLTAKKTEKGDSLSLIFDNGVDPEPLYSGPVQGKIFLDSQNRLCLTTLPLEASDEIPGRKEALFPNVKAFEFEFLGPANEDRKNERRINANLAWKTTWASPSPPSIIHLTIEEQQDSFLKFAFLVPSSNELVSYVKKEVE